MSSTCSTRCSTRYGRDMHLCALCEKSKGDRCIEIPDTPENLARVRRCQAQGWQIQRDDGTILAILCKPCADIVRLEAELNDEEAMLARAIEASVTEATEEDDNDEELQLAIALSRQDESCQSYAWSSTQYHDELDEPQPPEPFEWHDDKEIWPNLCVEDLQQRHDGNVRF